MKPIPTVAERPIMIARETFRPLGMSDTTGYQLLAENKFPVRAERRRGRWIVRTADLRRYLGLDEPP
jgi:predicted DNA-binding transcriptional regulator AlpA